MLSSDSPLSDWLAWLETLSPTEIDLGLERVEQVLQVLDLPVAHDVLLIAGTNGKGSSVTMADALLRATGKQVGAYTSPHIHQYNERIVVNGEPADDATIIAAFQKVNAARGDIRLTYFEFGTLAAAVVFADADLDVWILEVGLGGRLDATNAIQPTASLITNVALDHCDWLGDTVEAIAAEKAGVMRRDCPVVFGGRNMPDTITVAAGSCGARLYRAGVDFAATEAINGQWDWRSAGREVAGLRKPGLQGAFQVDNAAAVLMLLDAADLFAGIDRALLNQVLPEVGLRGRLQEISAHNRRWVLDVAHNPAAAQVLAESLAKTSDDGRLIAVIGVLADKDFDGVLQPLLPLVHQWIAVTPDNPRALSNQELGRVIANLSGKSCLLADSMEEALEFARRQATENDKILVTGSFFTVGPALHYLEMDEQRST